MESLRSSESPLEVRSDDPSAPLRDVQVLTNEELSTPVEEQGSSWRWNPVLNEASSEKHVSDPWDQFLIVIKGKTSSRRSTGLLLLEN